MAIQVALGTCPDWTVSMQIKGTADVWGTKNMKSLWITVYGLDKEHAIENACDLFYKSEYPKEGYKQGYKLESGYTSAVSRTRFSVINEIKIVGDWDLTVNGKGI